MSKIIAVIIAIMMIVQGGFFPKMFLGAGILLAILLLLEKQIVIDKMCTCCLLGIVLCYYSSGIFHRIDMFSFSYVLLLTIYMLGYMLVQTVLYHNQSCKIQFIYGVLVGALFISFIGIAAYMGVEMPGVIRNHRFMGTVQYANITACLLGIALYCLEKVEQESLWQYTKPLFAVMLFLTLSFGGIGCYGIGLSYLIIMDKKEWRKRLAKELIFYGMTVGIAIMLFVGKFLIQSFDLVFGAIVVLVSYSIFWIKVERKLIKEKKIKYINVAYVFLVLLGAGATCYISGNRAIQTFRERLFQWADGVHALQENGVLGIGPNQWENQVNQWRSANYSATILHNSYLQLAVDAGVVAAILVVILIGYLICRKRRRWLPYQKAIGGLLLIQSFFDIHLYFPSVLLIGIALLSQEDKENLLVITNSKWIRIMIVSVIFLLGISFVAVVM